MQRSAKGLKHAEAKLQEVQQRLAALESQQQVQKAHKHAVRPSHLRTQAPQTLFGQRMPRISVCEHQLTFGWGLSETAMVVLPIPCNSLIQQGQMCKQWVRQAAIW